MARPSKRTVEREQRLLDALRAGNTRKAACQYAGVDERTVERWAVRFVGFAASLTRAESEAEIRMTAIISQAAPNDWRAAAWWLERRRSDEYGRRDRLQVDVRQTAERLASELGLDPDELIAEAQRIIRGI